MLARGIEPRKVGLADSAGTGRTGEDAGVRQAERLRSLLPSGLRCAARMGAALVLSVSLALPTPTALAAQTATEGGAAVCDAFERIQSAIASEAARQPFAAQVEVARALVTKGACEAGPDFLAGLRVARDAASRGQYHNHHARAYFDLYSFDAALRESWALAAHIALTEQPPVRVYHFDRADAPRYAWWDDARACPRGDWVIGELRFC